MITKADVPANVSVKANERDHFIIVSPLVATAKAYLIGV